MPIYATGTLDRLKKTKRRTTEKVLQTIGQSEASQDDKDLDVNLKQWAGTKKQLVLLLSKFQLYADAVNKLQKCGESLSREMQVFLCHGSDIECDSRKELEDLTKGFAESQERVGKICEDFIGDWGSQVISPLRDVTFGLDREIKKKTAQRSADKIDFELYRRRSKAIAVNKNGKSTGSPAKQALAAKNAKKLSACKARYDSNHEYLKNVLERTSNNRSEMVVEELRRAMVLQKVLMQEIGDTVAIEVDEEYSRDFQNANGSKYQNLHIMNGGKELQEAFAYIENTDDCDVRTRPLVISRQIPFRSVPKHQEESDEDPKSGSVLTRSTSESSISSQKTLTCESLDEHQEMPKLLTPRADGFVQECRPLSICSVLDLDVAYPSSAA